MSGERDGNLDEKRGLRVTVDTRGAKDVTPTREFDAGLHPGPSGAAMKADIVHYFLLL